MIFDTSNHTIVFLFKCNISLGTLIHILTEGFFVFCFLPECHAAFSDWLLFVNNKYLRFPYIFSVCLISF